MRKKRVSAAATFRATFGPGVTYRQFTSDDERRLADRLPPAMLDLLRADGWCSYREQVLWLADPDEWAPALRAWLGADAQGECVLRSAFGDLFYWHGQSFWYLNPHEANAMMMLAPDTDWFFSRSITASGFAPSTHLPARVAAARAAVGPLADHEIYVYEPALALGGSQETSRIEKGSAVESHAMLAQLTTLRRY